MYSNVRTTIGAQRSGWSAAFNVAFRAGSVMGFALTGMAILVLYIALWGFRQYFGDDVSGRSTDCIFVLHTGVWILCPGAMCRPWPKLIFVTAKAVYECSFLFLRLFF